MPRSIQAINQAYAQKVSQLGHLEHQLDKIPKEISTLKNELDQIDKEMDRAKALELKEKQDQAKLAADLEKKNSGKPPKDIISQVQASQ